MAITRYTIQGDDTLHRIARRLLGHADQWLVLAEFNQLDYPYVDPTATSQSYPGKRVLTLGDVLLVPTAPDEAVTKRAALELDPDPYGVVCGMDLLVTATGDLQANVGSGDWSLASGLDNLMQALTHRLLTRKGELDYHPEYGSNWERHIGQPLDAMRVQLIRLDVMETMLADPRIKALARLDMTDQTDHLNIEAEVYVIGLDDVVPLNLVLPKSGA